MTQQETGAGVSELTDAQQEMVVGGETFAGDLGHAIGVALHWGGFALVCVDAINGPGPFVVPYAYAV